MEWRGRRQSENVVDRRGVAVGAVGGVGVILAILYALLGGDPNVVLDQVGASGERGAPQATAPAGANDPEREFVGVVLADTEDVWHEVFKELGERYVEPKLVLFSGSVRSACGTASTAVGPFYCPGDRQVYLDLDFFAELSRRLGAGGDFARAYVIAHEVGHHVQNLLGVTESVDAQRGRLSKAALNKLSVKLELQADCYAGIYATRTERQKHVLESGDVEEAMNAAAAVGDDRLQRQSRGYVVPDSFTHGTSEQRVEWFSRGLRRGEMADCDTFR